MKMKMKFRNLLIKALLLGLAWFIVALLISSITFINQFQIEGDYSQSLSILDVILFEVICIAPWAISTPLIIWATRKYRFEKTDIYRSFFAHFLLIIPVFIFHSIVQSYAVSIFYVGPFSWSYVVGDFFNFLDMRMMLYTGVLLCVFAVDYQRKIRESRLRNSRLNAQLNRARYQAFLNQIQPTFLLNTIDAIKEKSRVDSDESELLLTDFSDLLRIMLQTAHREEITIRKDLESYHVYLKILERRLGVRIEKEARIKESCYEALAPPFLMLIPVFEEVIFFKGNESIEIEGISYSAADEDNKLRIGITIEGLKISSAKLGMHLQNARFPNVIRQLEDRYDEAVEVKTKVQRGSMRIDLRIPFKIQPLLDQQVKKEDYEKVMAGRRL